MRLKISKGMFVYIVAALSIIFVVLVGWWFSDLYFARQIAPIQQTSDWMRWRERIPPGQDADGLQTNDRTIPFEIKPSVLLRADLSAERLLLKHNYGTIVYAYDSSTKIISEASEQEWNQAGGDIMRCRSVLGGDYNQRVEFSTYPRYAAMIEGSKINTYGKYSLLATESPNRSKVALLSAAGPLRGPGVTIIFGLGPGEPVVKGQKYVQIMDLTTKKFIGPPVRIEGEGNSDNYTFCWSIDENYLVIYKPYENFSIIETHELDQ